MKILPILSLFCFLFLFLACKPATAAKFSSVTVTLDRIKVQTQTGATVCATTPSSNNGTEASVHIEFPNGFSLQTNKANWTTTTTDIPSGATPWPGIGTATAVSGQDVTFPSSDLSPSTQYCFTISGTNTLTTPSSPPITSGILTTYTSSQTIVDQAYFGLANSDSDQVSINATILPKPSDLEASLSSPNLIHPNHETMHFVLTYGSHLLYATPLMVTAQWTQGTLDGETYPAIPVVAYIPGSATNAYNATQPIIDLPNQTLRWTIPSFPANTLNQTLEFDLQTDSPYTGKKLVRFNVSAFVTASYVQSEDSTLHEVYDPTKNPTPPPAPTNTPAPLTPTPIPLPIPLAITRLTITSISDHDATISITTSKGTEITVSSGLSPDALKKAVTALDFSTFHKITIPDLTPNTQYYFRILAKDRSGRTLRSDLFTFQTAKKSNAPTVDTTSVQLISQNVILTDNPFVSSSQNPIAVLPSDTSFSFYFSLSGKLLAKEIQAILTEKNVLGFSSFAQGAEANTDAVVLIPLQNGAYTGRLQTKTPGQYALLANIADYNGNLTQSQVATINVSPPFTVSNAITHQGIENARVSLSYYDTIKHVYNPLTSKVITIQNPGYTRPDGTLPMVLPQGKYKAEISAIGFDTKTVDFAIGSSLDQAYPEAFLQPTMFGALLLISTLPQTISDIWDAMQTAIFDFSSSHRFFDLLAFSVLSAFALLSLIAFQARTHIHLWDMPSWLLFHLASLHKKAATAYIQGKVVDTATNQGVSHAIVYFLDTHTNTLLSETKTNRHGHFFTKSLGVSYRVRIMKEGYSTHPVIIYDKQTPEVPFFMVDPAKHYIPLARNIRLVTQSLLSISYEMLLLVSLFLEVSFLPSIGIEKVLPFLILSLGNLLLWIFQLRDRALLGN